MPPFLHVGVVPAPARIAGLRAGVAAAALLLAVAVPAAAADLAVRLEEPDRADLLAGRVRLRARVEAPEGVAIGEVRFVVDGAPLATVRVPPYEATWEGIDTLRDHLLRVTAIAADGTRAYDLVSVPVLGPVTRATVVARPASFVLVDVTFVDGRGRPAVDVRADEVRLFEAGRRREIELFEPDTRPLAVQLLLDASHSTRPYWGTIAGSTLLFSRTLRPGDRAGVEAFQDESFVIAPIGSPPEEMGKGIGRFGDWGGGTRLYDALSRAALFKLGPEPTGRRALIVLTDGVDQVSQISEAEATDYLLRADVELHAVLFEPREVVWTGGYRRNPALSKRVRGLMEDLAAVTGGDAYPADEVPMQEVFVRIGERLRAQYLIGFTSDERRPPGRERKIEVDVRRAGLHARVRRGDFGGEAFGEFLARQILSGPESQQVVAARAAAMNGHPAAQRALVQALAAGEEIDRGLPREARLALLGADVRSVPYLREGMADARTRARAAGVLVDLLVILARSGRQDELDAAVLALGDGDPDAGRKALRDLRAEDLPDRTESLLQEILERLGPGAGLGRAPEGGPRVAGW